MEGHDGQTLCEASSAQSLQGRYSALHNEQTDCAGPKKQEALASNTLAGRHWAVLSLSEASEHASKLKSSMQPSFVLLWALLAGLPYPAAQHAEQCSLCKGMTQIALQGHPSAKFGGPSAALAGAFVVPYPVSDRGGRASWTGTCVLQVVISNVLHPYLAALSSDARRGTSWNNALCISPHRTKQVLHKQHHWAQVTPLCLAAEAAVAAAAAA
eukprot:1160459-Pelagomonas_calceolata.AAC.8